MEYKLSDLFDLQMGKTPDRHTPEYWTDGTEQWISISDLSKCDKYIEETAEAISEQAINDSGIKIIPASTVIMSFKLSIGKVAITPKPMYSNEAIMAFIDKGVIPIEPAYLYFLLKAKDWDEGTNKAVMGKTLNKATLSQVKVHIHDMAEQRKIIRALEKAESMVTTRRQQLTALDTLIKARFVEMFGEPETNPMQWNVALLKQLMAVEPQNGLYKPQSDYVQDGSGTPILRIDAFYDGRVTDFSLLKRLICSDTEKRRYLLCENDIVINRVNSIEYLGKCAHITGMAEDTVFESNMMRFHLDEKVINTEFATHLLCSKYIYNQILRRAKKAVNQASINQGEVQSLVMLVPPLELQNQFAAFVAQIDKSKAVVQAAHVIARNLHSRRQQKCRILNF